MGISAIRCNGKMLNFDMPHVMGIVNITPDSFYEGSRYSVESSIVEQADRMIIEGASIIDIGGQSTRPGSPRLTADEELSRILPAIKCLVRKYPEIGLSVDTYHSLVARAAIDEGVSMINDVSAGEMDPEMIPLMARLKVPYIAMHMQGRPESMQIKPYYDSVVDEILHFFQIKIKSIRDADNIDLIIDPGFGFGKSIAHNYEILSNLSKFRVLGCPVMVGISRKSFIQKTLDVDAEAALNGTTAVHMIALMNGADLLRVHDVKAAVEAVKIFMANKNAARL